MTCPACEVEFYGDEYILRARSWVDFLEQEKGLKTEAELEAENLRLKVFPEKEPETPVRQGFWKSLRKWLANED
jgi:hypothetical protein